MIRSIGQLQPSAIYSSLDTVTLPMDFLVRNSFLQRFLLLLAFFSAVCCGVYALQYTPYWYSSLFLEAHRNHIHSYRVVSILSDRDCTDSSLLGEIKSLAKASRTQNPSKIPVKIELWIQDLKGSAPLEKIRDTLSPYSEIEVRALSEVLPLLQQQELPSWVSLDCDPSSLSFLKLWALKSSYDHNLYIDPTLWAQYSDRSHMPIAAYAYGAKGIEKAKRSFYMRRSLPGPNKTSLDYAHAYSDFLMAKKDSWDLLAIQKRLLLRDQLYGSAFRGFEEEDRRLDCKTNQSLSFSQRQRILNQRLQWFKANPDLPMQTRTLGSYLFGNMFLEKALAHFAIGGYYTLGLGFPPQSLPNNSQEPFDTYASLALKSNNQEDLILAKGLAIFTPVAVT